MLYLTLNPNKPGELDRLSAITSLLVRYHSPGCGHCVAMKEEWAALKNHKKLKDKDITVIDVESSLTPQIKHKSARLPESQGVPTIVFIQGDKVKEHKGAREADAMANFAIEQMGQSGGGKRKGTKRKSRKKSKKIHSIKRKPIIKGTRNIRNKRLIVKKKRKTTKRRRNKRKGKRRTNRRKIKKGGMNQEDEDDELVRVAVPRDENEEQDEEDQLVRVRFGRLPNPNFENEIEDNPPTSSSSAATSSSSALNEVKVRGRNKRGGYDVKLALPPEPRAIPEMPNQDAVEERERERQQQEARRGRRAVRLVQEHFAEQYPLLAARAQRPVEINTSSEEQPSCNVAGCTVMGGRKKTRKRKKGRSKGGTALTRGQEEAAKDFVKVEAARRQARVQAQIAREKAQREADEKRKQEEDRKQCTVMGGRKKTKKRKKRRSKKYN